MELWEKFKMLVVDDDPFITMLVSLYLKPTKIQITHAGNGKEAVQLCKNNQFDIIVMNIQMPVMDGFKATIEIRGFNKEIPIIANTTYHYDPERFSAGGFNDYIFPPFTMEDIRLMIKKHLGISEFSF